MASGTSNSEHWTIAKPAVAGRHGLVASQHYRASAVGARVLADGGNAVDAAIATALSIGVVEPWMSGLGGGGVMLVSRPGEAVVHGVDFGMVAPQALDPADYPLSEAGTGGDLFGWPSVVGDRNVRGPLAIAAPGAVAGLAKALERHGTRSWADLLAPAIDLAGMGLEIDWYATLLIAGSAAELAAQPQAGELYLRDGRPPAVDWNGNRPCLPLPALEATLRTLADEGPDAFYRGAIGERLVADVRAVGGRLAMQDLADYRARPFEAAAIDYRGARIHAPPGLTAGPTLFRALELLAESDPERDGPAARSYLAYARGLRTAYAERLETMGDSDGDAGSGCTTHISVVDADGMMVSLTQTLLSLFGSKILSPETGILLNNGIMWFDPRPGRPNSMAPGRRPLSNMCPAIVDLPDGRRMALGASGGRRIMPAIFQLASFAIDHGMDLDAAFSQPRIDASGDADITIDPRLPETTRRALSEAFPTRTVQHGVLPIAYACPNAVIDDRRTGEQSGAAYLMSPWARVVAAQSSPTL